MQDFFLGILAILAGAFFCFRGQVLLRLVIPIWGAFAGFSLGAGLVAGFAGDRFLGTALGWVVGFVFALVFAILAYLYYAIGVVIAMSSIGFSLGAALMVALGIDWNWVVVIVGILVGALLAVFAILTDLPMLLLILLSGVAGASVLVTGLMLMFGAVDSADFTQDGFTSRVHDDWWWYALFLVLAFAGVISQSRDAAAVRRSMRESWT
ncbi:putative integral membrane protein [metagenome]|uniref:Putative integral membrane protein n=1 Tax=metagenome TaxID=256318 RepID=A0A2P2C6G5_9ZZZZ